MLYSVCGYCSRCGRSWRLAVNEMRRRIYDPCGKQDRQRHPDAPNAPGSAGRDTHISHLASLRTLKVEPWEPTPNFPNAKEIIRRKGQWLAAIFTAQTRVGVKAEPGRIVFEPTEQ